MNLYILFYIFLCCSVMMTIIILLLQNIKSCFSLIKGCDDSICFRIHRRYGCITLDLQVLQVCRISNTIFVIYNRLHHFTIVSKSLPTRIFVTFLKVLPLVLKSDAVCGITDVSKCSTTC